MEVILQFIWNAKFMLIDYCKFSTLPDEFSITFDWSPCKIITKGGEAILVSL